MKHILTAIVIIFIISVEAFSQGQYPTDIGKNYMIPDIGVPGYSTKIEIIAKYNGHINNSSNAQTLLPFDENTYSFGAGMDGLYLNEIGDDIRVICSNSADNSKITIGPLVVSSDGHLITTQIFVHHFLNPNSFIWYELNPEFKIPISVYKTNSVIFIDTFYVVQPFPAYSSTNPIIELGDGEIGLNEYAGIRSPRGAIIFEDLNLSNGIYKINTSDDCDPYSAGNQAYLPATIISLKDIYIDSLDISADGKDAGPGGGGGGAGSRNGMSGNGFSSGGHSCSGPGSVGQTAAGSGESSGDIYTNNTGSLFLGGFSLNGIPGGTGICDQGGGGGTGNPLGLSGGAGTVGFQTPMYGGYGAGSAGGERDIGGGGGITYGGGGASYAQHGQDGEGNVLDTSFISNAGYRYGNRYVVPLAGGSGGGAGNVWSQQFGGNGGGGGGAVSVYAYGSTQINGIRAKGADGTNGVFAWSSVYNFKGVSGGGGGSGGGVIIGAKNGNTGANIINVDGGDKGYGGFYNGNQISNDTASHDGGLGSPGRVRIDGTYTQKIISDSASFGVGPTSDSARFIVSNTILHGTGDGGTIRIYVKPQSQLNWQLEYSIYSYTDTWSYELDLQALSFIDDTFFVAIMQEIPPPYNSEYCKVPEYIFSQLSTNIFVTNRPTIAVSDTAFVFNQATSFIDVQANDYDLNGDPFTTSILSGPNYGSASVVDGDSIQFIPDTSFAGNDTIVYIVCDNSFPQSCDTAFVYLFVYAPNAAPITSTLYFNTFEEVPVFTDTLATIEDAELDTITITILNPGDIHGTIDLTIDDFTYTPNDDYYGIDTIVYQACDSQFPPACSIDTIFITVENIDDPPIIVNENEISIDEISVSTDEDTPISVCLNVIDVESNALDINFGSASNGEIIYEPLSDTCFIYQPDSNFFGIDTATIYVCETESSLLCDSIDVIINVLAVNDTVSINDENGVPIDYLYTSTPEDTPIIICLEVSDAENDLIDLNSAYSITNNGLIDILPMGDTCIVYQPNENFTGVDTIVAFVCETSTTEQLCDSIIIVIDITPEDDAPQVVDSTGNPIETIELTTDEDTPVEICFDINDPDNDIVDVSSILAITNNGTIDLLPPNDTCIVYNPNPNFAGIDSFYVIICEQNPPYLCDSVLVIVDVLPENDSISIVDGNGDPLEIMYVTTQEDVPAQICFDVLDPDGDIIDVTNGYSILNNGQIIYSPTGDTCIVYEPNTDYFGIDSLIVYVCETSTADMFCDSILVVINITPQEDSPEILDENGIPSDTINVIVQEDIESDICFDVYEPDGDPVDVVNIIPVSGIGTINPQPIGDTCVSYLSGLNFFGTDTFIAIVCQTSFPMTCDSVVVIVEVTPENDSIYVVDNTGQQIDIVHATTPEETAVEICLNAFDPDSGYVDVFGGFSINGNGSIYFLPLGDTCFTYIPNTDFFGNDTLTIEICETQFPFWCNTVTVVVDVTPVNDTVVIVENGIPVEEIGVLIIEDTPKEICIEVEEVDGQSVDVTNWYSVTNNGYVDITPLGDTCFTYIPNLNFLGTDSIWIYVCETICIDCCDSVLVIINVLPQNDPPFIIDSLGFQLDTLFLSTYMDSTVEACVEFFDYENNNAYLSSILNGPSNGSFSILEGDSCISYTPFAEFSGNDTIWIEHCDDGIPPACDSTIVIINVIPDNTAPIILQNSLPIDTIFYTIMEDESILLCLDVWDYENDSLDITSAISLGGNSNIYGISSGDTCISIFPNSDFYGSDSILVIVCDDGIPFMCDSVYVYINVTSIPDPPSSSLEIDGITYHEDSVMGITTNEDESFNFCLTIFDPEFDSYSISFFPPPTLGIIVANLVSVGLDSCFIYYPDSNAFGH